ncbi:MAG: hypothetical protein JJT89_13790 [Nitriliruptoraceae bacterium]|nr:hypothetical protein [Nitriliruptoraceae bacterium]
MTEHTALEALAARLWDERRIVTYLLYRLTVTKLLLAADERRFVPSALEEVDQAVTYLRDGEDDRDLALRDLAAVWQVDPVELGLADIAERAPEPFATMFQDHLNSFRDLAAEIDVVATANRALANERVADITETISHMSGMADLHTPTTYDASGRVDTTGPVGGRLREVL